VTLTDNRSGESIEIPIVNGGVDAGAWKKLLGNIWFADPGFTQTAATESAITELDGDAGILRYRGYPIEQLAEHSTYLDGDNGVLRYRGYPIEQLAEKSSFLEVAYLLVHGDLPTAPQLDQWVHDVTHHTFVHENVRTFMQGFRYDAHPMGMLESSVGMLSTLYPESKDLSDDDNNMLQIVRLIAKMPTLGAFAYRHITGKPFVYPNNELSYPENFLSMLFTTGVPQYEPDPRLVKALDVLFILHADHEQNCCTTAVRGVGSSQAFLMMVARGSKFL
jgi:citrate synthase